MSDRNKLSSSCTSKPTRVLTFSFKPVLQSLEAGFHLTRAISLHPRVLRYRGASLISTGGSGPAGDLHPFVPALGCETGCPMPSQLAPNTYF